MKIVISKEELMQLTSKLQTIITHKPAIPILSNVLIEAYDDQIILNATDLTTSIRCFAEAKIVEEGALALPAKRFFQLIRELTTSQIKISSTSQESAEIVSGGSIFKINGISKSEFPTLPTISGAKQMQIAPLLLKEMFSRTVFSVTRENSSYVLNGILLQIMNGIATLIGTDGKRLAKITSPINTDTKFQGTYILPLKAVEEMIKMLDNEEKITTISLTHDKFFLEYNNTILITKLLSGQYPDVERVIPENPTISVVLHREELITLLRQVSLFTTESNASVRFSFSSGQLELSAASSEIGEGIVSMPVDYKGKKLEIAFNPFYFQDILRHSKEETVKFDLTDSYNPGIISDSTSALFVIMPMRLAETEPIATENNDSQTPAFA